MQATHAALVATQVPNAPDRVADLLDATQEQMDDMQEVADVVGNAAEPMDEELIDQEMDLLLQQSLPSHTDVVELPFPPENPVPHPAPQKEEKDVVDQMAEWAEL